MNDLPTDAPNGTADEPAPEDPTPLGSSGAGSEERRWITALAGPAPRHDLVAGCTVAAVVVPQSLAYATLAGMPPVTGLYAALAALAVYAVVGSSPVLSVNPTATSSILAAAAGTAVGVSSSDDPGRYAAVLAMAAVLAGGLAMAAGLLRLGFLSNLLSRPVLTGYAAGAATIIAVGQVESLLGVDVGRQVRVVPLLTELAGALGDSSTTTLGVGVASLATVVAIQRFVPRLPAAVLVMAGAVVAARLFDLAGHGVAVGGHVPGGLPGIAWPDLPAGDVRSLLLPAVALALVSFTEAVAQGRTFSKRPDGGVDANRELLALGAVNTASGLCGGFANSASFSCTAINDDSGARTRRAGAVTGGMVALTLIAFTGLFEQLPTATLAAVVIVAVVPLIRVRTFRRLARLQRDDFVYALAAAAGTLLLGILPGLAVAVALSIGGLLYRVTTADTEVLGYVPEQDTWRSLDRHATARPAPGVVVLRFAGPLYFANAARLRHEVTELVADASPRLRRVVIDGRAVNHIDVTALDMLADLHARLARHDIELVTAGLRGAALDTLLRSDLAKAVGAGRLAFSTVRQAVRAANGANPAGAPGEQP